MRLALLAYPPSFRKGYGDEMARCVRDLRDHGGMSRGRLGLHVAGGELSEPLWVVWALSFVTGLSLLVLGLVALVAQRGGGRRVA